MELVSKEMDNDLANTTKNDGKTMMDLNKSVAYLSGNNLTDVRNGSDNISGNLGNEFLGSTEIPVEIFLAMNMGPRRQALYIVIPITIIYCLIFLTGMIGNICTCIVIARRRYMHTATNYYLFNLAVSDLILLITGLPQETYSYWYSYPWIFGETYCVMRAMAAEASTYASILTITAFTVERYVAIVHPMKAQAVSSLPRAIKVIVLIWIFSTLCSVPTFVQFRVFYLSYKGQPLQESAICGVRLISSLKYSFEISTILFFFLPMIIITVLYVLIGIAVRRSAMLSRSGSDSSSSNEKEGGTELRSQQQIKARRAVLKMLVAVVVAFFICYAPFNTQRLVYGFYSDQSKWSPTLRAINHVFFYISGILYYVSSVINPVLYNIMSLKFRRAFKNTIFTPCRRGKNRTRSTYVAYKFCRGQMELDSDVSVLRLQKGGGENKQACNGLKHRSDSRSRSSGGGTNSGKVLSSSQRELKSFSSLSEGSKSVHLEVKTSQSLTPRTAYTHLSHETRPYHSYA